MFRFRSAIRVLGGLALGLCTWTAASPCLAVEEPSAAERIIEDVLAASFPGDADAAALTRDQLSDRVETIADRFGKGRPTYRRARRMHELLHQRYLLQYDADADGMHHLVDDGRFNCLSATLFEGLVARALGYGVEIVQYPRHVLLRLHFGERVVDVESTAPEGFDVRIRRGFAGSAAAPGLVASPWLGGYPEPFSLSIESAVGFVWLNRAHRLLETGDPLAAARSVVEAGRHLPDLADRVEGVRPILARAFRQEYDAGRFERAYAVAKIEAGLFPESVSSRDRVAAAALKRIEKACDGGDPRGAAELIDVAAGLMRTESEHRRLVRGASPLIVVAAVRVEDWALAGREAGRYARAEPDPVEARRLTAWLELRRSSPTTADGRAVQPDAPYVLPPTRSQDSAPH
jgi:hypothetical protein